jgi:hypothetical protein
MKRLSRHLSAVGQAGLAALDRASPAQESNLDPPARTRLLCPLS